MKRLYKIVLFIILLFCFSGCIESSSGDTIFVKSPNNLNLSIKGIWKLSAYNILDENIVTNEDIYNILSNDIIIKNNSIEVGGKLYTGISYKLKYVEPDYSLSYEANVTLDSLDIHSNIIEVYSITFDNNLLCEIIKKNNEKAYIYYQGILFDIIYSEDIINEEEKKEEESIVIKDDDNEFNSSQGILLGLKSKENGKEEESYRTIWISVKSGTLQKIRQQNNIWLPRKSGFWILEDNKVEFKDKNIYYEYFLSRPIDAEINSEEYENNIYNMSEGKSVKKEINYIGSDYVAMEIKSNEKFADSPVYKVLPIDNILSEKGIEISELFTYNVDKMFKSSFDTEYIKADSTNKDKLNKSVNYSNYTLKRNNGMWSLVGRISPIIVGGEAIDFPLKITPSKSVVIYDTLVVPWKVLKGEIPLLVDAFTSPDASIAIIITNSDIKGYTINNGILVDDPFFSISLKEGEEVIMAEWCEDQYIDKWDLILKDNSIIIG